jgi:hypothetical protein
MLLLQIRPQTIIVPDEAVFSAKDNLGVGLDCLKIVGHGRGHYLGVHHSLQRGRFETRLASSEDLVHWSNLRTLDEHASQGYLYPVGKEWLLAYEKDGPSGNWIRICAYNSDKALLEGRPSKTFDIDRSLSKFAEGTPNVIEVQKGLSWEHSKIKIGFHYFRNGDVDRQAEGTLVNWKSWSAKIRVKVNAPLEKTYLGNIGDRDRFQWKGKTTEWLEGQLRKNDWSSWRILSMPKAGSCFELHFKTPNNSISFANPNVTTIELPNGQKGLVITLFLPSEGSGSGEAGELIFWLQK